MADYDNIIDSMPLESRQPKTTDYGAIIDADAENRRQRLQQSVQQATQTPPEQAGKVRQLVDASGMPPDVVTRNLQAVEAQKRARDLVEASRDSPILRWKLENPEFGKIAQDQGPELSTLEKVVRSPWTAAKLIGSGVVGMGEGITGALAAPFEDSAQIMGRGPNSTAGMIGSFLRETSSALNKYAKRVADVPEDAGNVEAGIASGLQSIGTNLGPMALAIMGGAPKLGLSIMSAITGGQSYTKGREAGLSPLRASVYGGVDAGFEYLTEVMPTMKLLGDMKAGTPFVKMFMRNQFGEQIGEQAATVLQDFNEYATLNPDKPFSDYLKARPDAAIQTAIATLVGSGGQVAILHALDRVGPGREAQAAQAKEHAGVLDELMKHAAASKLRERSIPAFADFVQSAADAGPVSAVYMNAQLFAQSAQKAGINVEATMPETARDLAQALDTQADVRIPLGELTSAIPGTSLEQSIVEHLRTSRDAPTLAETASAEWVKDTEAQTASILAKNAHEIGWNESVTKVADGLHAQLDSVKRFAPDVNRAYANWMSAFYSTQAARLGITPEEMFQRYPLQLAAQSTAAAGTLDQSDPWRGDHSNAFVVPADKIHLPAKIEGTETTSNPLNDATVAKYAEEIKAGARPVITISEPGARAEGDYYAVDGNHRLAAYKALGITDIPVRVQGTSDAAREGFTEIPNGTPAAKYSGTLNQSEAPPAPVYFSALTRQIEGAKIKVAPADQWKKFIAGLGQKGVKKEEVMLSGINDWLDLTTARDPAARITRENVLEYLATNGTKVEVIVRGEKSPLDTGASEDEEDDPDREPDTPDEDEVRRRAEQLWEADAAQRADNAFEQASQSDSVGLDDPVLVFPDARIKEFTSGVFGIQRVNYGDDSEANIDDVDELDEPEVDGWETLDDGVTMREFPTREAAEAYAKRNDFNLDDPHFTIKFTEDDDGDTIGAYDTADEAQRAGERAQESRIQSEAEFYMENDSFEDDEEFYMDRAREDLQEGIDYNREPPTGYLAVRHAGNWQSSGGSNYREMVFSVPGIEPYNENDSTHFQPETGGRTIAWARFKVHGGRDGKPVLFIEELQSQRGQAGKEEGFKGHGADVAAKLQALGERFDAIGREAQASLDADVPTVPAGYAVIVDRGVGDGVARYGVIPENQAHGQFAFGARPTEEAAIRDAIKRVASIQQNVVVLEMQALNRRQIAGVPTAPFVEDTQAWTALALKRLIRYAADKGITKIAWTPGKQQVDRYGGALRDRVDSIGWKKVEGGVEITPMKDLHQLTMEKYSSGDLRAALGGAMADRIMNDSNQEGAITGEHITIDDTGMSKYYGDGAGLAPDGKPAIVTIVANKIAKQLGGDGVTIIPMTVSEGHSNEYNAVPGFKLTPEMAAKAQGGFSMFQTEADKNRGSITLNGDIKQTPPLITLNANADLSTFLHESGHFYLEVLADMAAQPDAPPGIMSDFEDILKWFGVTDLSVWNSMTLEEKRPHHEKFARGFERYLFEGVSPSVALKGAFARFRSWLVNIYKSGVGAFNSNLTPEVRGVMDRLVATNEEILQAEAVRSYAPLFDSKPAELTDTEWQDYVAGDRDATQDAVDNLQTRSVRDLAYATNMRSRAIKALQDEAKTKRDEVHDEVAAEVNAEPIYRLERFLRKGEEQPETVTHLLPSHKLSSLAVTELFPESMLTRPDTTKLRGMTAPDGLLPDDLAQKFGFVSGEALVRQLIEAEPAADKIERVSTERMLERHGDLTDPAAIEKAASEAVANDARAKFIATELNLLDRLLATRKGLKGERKLLAQAAKDYAAKVIARRLVKDIKPGTFESAAARAARNADKAFKAGDLATAASEKRVQLVNTYATRAAYDALAEVDKAKDFFRRVLRGNAETIAKTRDPDMVNAARAILAAYGIGTKGEKAGEYLKAVEKYDPAMYASLRDRVDNAEAAGKPFNELSFEELQGLRDEVDSLWYLARRSRQMEIDGKLRDREDVQKELHARLEKIGIPKTVPGEKSAITDSERRLAALRSLPAMARRVEAWAQSMDGSVRQGPFRRLVWNPVREAADRYRSDKAQHIKAFRALLKPIEPSMKRRKIDAPELGAHGYTFGEDQGGVGLGEILHAILHTGNDSNKRKLLLAEGRAWATEVNGVLDTTKWDTFIARLAREGTLTKAHFDFVQGVWDLLDSMKPLAQETHREVFGHYFDEVTAHEVDTPFGKYKGGYVPAIVDPRIVLDANLHALAEADNASMVHAFPTTNKGFTKSRVEYNKPLLLDLRTLAQHIDKVLLFSHLERPIRDVRRVLTSDEVADPLNRIQPEAFPNILTPWLKRAASQQVETPVSGSKDISRLVSGARRNAGMSAMIANVSNAVQQFTGMSTALLKVPPKYLLGAMASYAAHPKQMAETVAAASQYMDTRMSNEVAQMNADIKEILLDPTLYSQAHAWTAKHAYFLQTAADNVIGPIIWTGAYNHALETAPKSLQGDELERHARREADSAVRETQGSTMPEDISRMETGPAWARIFTQFAGFFNTQANLLGTEFANNARELGLKKGAGRGLYILTFGLLVPAWASELIAQLFKGGPGDDDKDGEYLDDWLMAVFGMGTVKYATAMAPFIGATATAAINAWNNKPYDDRVALAPAVSMVESALRAGPETYKAIFEDGKPQKAVRDVATLLGMLTGLPFAALARPVGYAAGVAHGDIVPTSAADYMRGLAQGTASPESKQ